jgi:hypothetical protein
MTSDPKVIGGQTIALTAEELDVLSKITETGDRAGFYMAYNAMTGIDEAALQ